ncbi:MAG TPA: hypothetical protein VFU05_01375, partial [Cyclobacteriaceae bacterium]|nr:hypothetical protein [Cyclobacteriaceae bacterium]
MASLTQYQKGDYNYPSDHTNPDLKEEKTFIRQYAEAFYADFAQNRCLIPYFLNKSSFIAEARAYSTGTQSEDKIKDHLCKKNSNGQYVTKMNISWRNVDIMSNVFDTIRAINQGVSFDTSVSCIDPETVQVKMAEQEFMKFFIDKSTQEFLAQVQFQPKMPIHPDEIGIKTKRDAELFFQAGGMMLLEEIAAVACTDKAKLVSQFQVIQDKWNDDLIQIGFTGAKNEINKVSGDAYPRYVEPALAAIPWSKFRDFRDITRAGELRFMTIGEIAKEAPHLSEADLERLSTEFADIGTEYEMWAHAGGIVPTPAMSSAGRGAGAGTPREFLKVPVFDFQFLSVNTYKHIENTRSSGKFFTKEVGYGHDLSKDEKKKGDSMYHEQRVCKYFGKWIVGTDMFIDCGKSKNQNYIDKGLGMVPSLDYFFVQTGNKSVVARCIEHIDMINLLDKKMQNALISLPPAPRMMIKKQVLENVVLNGKVQTQDDF